jgi:peptidoglycan/LPS O-acetylase OafA/YrhL
MSGEVIYIIPVVVVAGVGLLGRQRSRRAFAILFVGAVLVMVAGMTALVFAARPQARAGTIQFGLLIFVIPVALALLAGRRFAARSAWVAPVVSVLVYLLTAVVGLVVGLQWGFVRS